MTCKAEIRLGEQSEKVKSWWEKLWNEIQLKGFDLIQAFEGINLP